MPNCSLGPDDCDFEFGPCQWKIIEGDYTWFLNQGETKTKQTGPNIDHTTYTPDGHYVYAEGSTPARPGMNAFLNSKLFPPNKGRFMIFWYHMFGRNIGKLSVQLQLQNGTSSILWEQSGDQGWNWLKATVNVTADQSHSVSFIAERGNSFRCDIAIDDVTFESMNPMKSKPEVKVQKLGCFRDRIRWPVFPSYKDLRDQIDWSDLSKTVEQCGNFTLSKGLKYFGLQFYGECWYAENDIVNYEKYGPSENCYSEKNKIVGAAGTIMVYQIITEV